MIHVSSFAAQSIAFRPPAQAKSLQVLGCAGPPGEWELTATVTEETRLWTNEFSGPLAMKHVGICTQDGPEEKTGELRFHISALTRQLNATFLLEGIECSCGAQPSESYSGMMACRDREAAPPKLWLK